MKQLTNNPFWQEIQRRLNDMAWVRFALTITTGVVLPIAIAVFVNLATQADKNGLYITAIIFLAILQIALVLIRAGEDWRSPLSLLGQAAEVHEQLVSRNHELKRREAAYAVIRDSLVEMNAQVCRMDEAYGGCDQGFADGISRILSSVLNQAALVLGVGGQEFSFQVYFQSGCFFPSEKDAFTQVADDLDLVCLIGNGVTSDRVLALGDRDPGVIGMRADPFSRSVDDLPEVYGKVRDALYFRRFAWSHIYAICPNPDPDVSPAPIGVVVLTSQQSAPFAEDVLDTLSFLSVAISKYLWTYEKCVQERQSRETQVNSDGNPPLAGDAAPEAEPPKAQIEDQQPKVQ